MKLRDKLGKLPPPKDAAPRVPPNLDELRAKMAELLQVPEATRDPHASALPSGFPFDPRTENEGQFHVLEERVRPSHHVGAFPVDAAKDVEPEVLSLLALDPALSVVDPAKVLFLDTETTGLRGSGVLPFLVGLAWFDDERRLILEQFLLKDPTEEEAMLEALRTRLRRSSYLATFNGKSYDWPLLMTRTVMNQLPPFAELPHLDLLPVARRLHRTRLGACKLTLLEERVLGFSRGEGDIAGAEIAPRYSHFLRSGDYEALRPVVEHNRWDVLTMAALVGLYGEPVRLLHPDDLAQASKVAGRAKDFDVAGKFIESAIDRGAQSEALITRALLSKARGDRGQALLDFEAASRTVTDDRVALELTKLYEHHAKDFERAYYWLERGTGESAEDVAKRTSRLQKKREQGAKFR